MFIAVTLTRRIKSKGKSYCSTCTKIREYCEYVTSYGGPNRAINEVAKEAASRYSSDWSVSCLQISEYEYKAALRERDCEKMTIERMTGIKFDECWRLPS